jgi:predicted acylesterase/phospholipase RssA
VAASSYNPPLATPVIGTEPDFLAGLSMDNAVGAIIALTAEVYLLRERLQSLEAELGQRKILPVGAVENHQPPPEDQQRRQDDLAAFTQRILAELTRDRTPVSQINPGVAKYLRTHLQSKDPS